MLSGGQRKAYEKDGYLVLRCVFSSEQLEPVRQVINRVVDRRARKLLAEGKIRASYDEAPFHKRWAKVRDDFGPDFDKQTAMSWGRLELLDKAIYDLLTHPSTLEIAQFLLGPEVTAHGDFWVRPKLPSEAITTLAWHQDSFYYAGPESGCPHIHILSMWLPLVDVDETNGCLQVVPGSHRLGLLPHRRNKLGQQEPIEDFSAKAVSVPMKVGDILLFSQLTLHRSLPNLSDHVRWSIDLRYGPTGQPFTWHSLGDIFKETYPCFIARSEDPSRRETWEQWRAKWNLK